MTGVMYSMNYIDAARVNAQLLDENGVFIKDIKFSLDPTIMSFDMLQSLLAKAFEVRRDFSISYVATDHLGSSINLALLNDWDLDAAILSSSDPSLVLTVQLKPIDLCLEDWDVVGPADISDSKPQQPAPLPPPSKTSYLFNRLSERCSSLRGLSCVGRFIDCLEDLKGSVIAAHDLPAALAAFNTPV